VTRRARWAVVLVALGVVGVGATVWGVSWLLRPPTFTCSTTDTEACSHTTTSILYDRDYVFAQPLPGRLVAVDIRPAPPEWTILPEYYDGSWAAMLTLEQADPVLVACYYSSDTMVACNLPDGDGNPY
jgi:hypothetical protein